MRSFRSQDVKPDQSRPRSVGLIVRIDDLGRSLDDGTLLWRESLRPSPLGPSRASCFCQLIPCLIPQHAAVFGDDCAVGPDDEPVLHDAQLVGDGGPIASPHELTLLERTVTGIDGVDKLLASFDPAGLRAGDYTLEVAVRSVESGVEQRSSIELRVN